MIQAIDLNNLQAIERIIPVQKASYQIEADIIGYADLPPLKDSATDIQQTGESFYGYYENKELAGFVSYELENEILTVCRLAVHPNHFKKGIATALLHHLFLHQTARKVVVTTGKGNNPAILLYKKFGFEIWGEIPINEQLSLIKLVRKA
ncbi:ribosomal protein S18 acetylase RimI-like enzyme [Salirhabdus euzebyi]|uniref:Ribosomal protein S18 acetylase RimI-like enzyme n=1 Tax=Salirhabdus euzebyi TaxID=394506 RepID=A0A841Q5B8_9BACI|nr:GNAT family N-acetyltransferase [Salirhabdus euzebyi]MBB6453557.1 ribosomal protein S18 acetylase RimI-like enzyme [Salirhabdus euzebyi]